MKINKKQLETENIKLKIELERIRNKIREQIKNNNTLIERIKQNYEVIEWIKNRKINEIINKETGEIKMDTP